MSAMLRQVVGFKEETVRKGTSYWPNMSRRSIFADGLVLKFDRSNKRLHVGEKCCFSLRVGVLLQCMVLAFNTI